MFKLFIFIMACIIIIYNYQRSRLVSSSSLWVFCYVLIFVVYPTYEKNIIFENEFLIDVVAFIGLLCYFIGLTFGSRLVINKNKERGMGTLLFPKYKIANICFWIFFALSILILMKKLGTSGMMSIISGNMTAKQFALENDSSSSAYVFSVHLLVPCVLCLWMTAESSKQRINSIVCLFIYILETVLFGFTRIFLISIVAMILIYEIRNKSQRKQVLLLTAGIAGLVIVLVAMNFVRTFGLNTERSFKDMLDLEYVFESTDFSSSYHWFDELLKVQSPFVNPVVYLKPILAIVPRTIWTNKPEPLSLQILKYISPAMAATGYSTAGNSVLGEGYAVCGYFGMFLFPFLWGTVCGKLDKRYYKRLNAGEDHCLQNICYYIFAVFIVISGQRGDWCQYMTIVIWFYILPMYIMSKISLKV